MPYRGRRAFGAVILSGVLCCQTCCTVGPDWSKPRVWAPRAWTAGAAGPSGDVQAASRPVADTPDPAWWRILRDDSLNALESRVAAANFSVRLAAMRFVESRAQRQSVGADQFPSAQADGSYTREEISRKGVFGLFGGGASGGSSFAGGGGAAGGLSGRSGGIPAQVTGGQRVPPFNLFQYGFDASWELDVWGRVRREVESADASVEASAEARRDTLLSVLAEVARDYVQLRAVQARLAITRRNLATERDSLALTQERFRGGLTSALDVANAATQLHATEAQIPPLAQQESEAVNALSLLLGEGPGALRDELSTARPLPPLPPRVPIGIPSELARRRPDIRQAEAQLHEATAEIGVAVADFYPRVTLDGSVGVQALRFKNLGSWGARQYGLGPSVSLPIFAGGRLRATLQLREAQQQEAAISYQQTVLLAWHDVDNALTAYASEQARHDALAAAEMEAESALDLARQRYARGLSDFLNVLDAQRALLSAQLQVSDSQAQSALNLVQLYKALGGGWEVDYPAMPKA